MNEITAIRVVYGKSDTPIEDREYHSRLVGGSGIGTRKDWLTIAKGLQYDAVVFIEKDGTREKLNV